MNNTAFHTGWSCNGAAVTLPYDAMIHESRKADNPSSAGGYFPGGKYVYEKTFPKPDAEHVLLQFEAVYRNARITVEGGELLAFGSANPRTEERFDEGTYTTCYGTALAAVRVNGNTTVTVTDGKETARATITVVQ